MNILDRENRNINRTYYKRDTTQKSWFSIYYYEWVRKTLLYQSSKV